MEIDAALIKEQGVEFAIIVVKSSITSNPTLAEDTIIEFGKYFSDFPIVLMSQDFKGIPTYYGRTDIVDFLINVPLDIMPWKRYTFS